MKNINSGKKKNYDEKIFFDPNLVKRIMEIQSLPEEVVIQFFKAGGSLGKSNIDDKEIS